MKVAFSAPSIPKSGTLAFLLPSGAELIGTASEIEAMTGGALSRAMKVADWSGKAGQVVEILAPHQLELDRILLVGTGKPEKATRQDIEAAGARLFKTLKAKKLKTAGVVIEHELAQDLPADEAATALALGAKLMSYEFTRYKTKKTEDSDDDGKAADDLAFEKLNIGCDKAKAAKALYANHEEVIAGVFLTRDLASEPANVLHPISYAEKIEKELGELGVKVDILNDKQMRKLGMGGLLGVAEGSQHEGRLVIMEWNGLDTDAASDDKKTKSGKKKSDHDVLALVGKGVTFDSGGISLKPGAGMQDMKWDMGGSAVVVGTMRALAGRKAKTHVIGLVGLVENMPDGTAQRPGDVVTTMSGQTVEIINTDAEGRMVLCDVLTYAQRTYQPKEIIDLATLTGAIIVSLGHENSGLFSNNDDLSQRLKASGEAVRETMWPMPLGKEYDKLIDSDIADMKNTGGRWAGSITAAQFLYRYIEHETPWAHIDIAGTTWSEKGRPLSPKGATGWGVRMLDHFVKAHYERK